MKMCKTILPCILLLSGLVVMMAAAQNITETTVPDLVWKIVETVTEATVSDKMGETVGPVTKATIPDTTGKAVAPITDATVMEVEGETMALITDATVPDKMGKTVAPVTNATVSDTSGKMVAPVTNATVMEAIGDTVAPVTETTVLYTPKKMVTPVMKPTITEVAGETVATVPDKLGKTLVPVTKATIPVMTTMTIVLGHKNISTSGLPLVKSLSSTVKISTESTFFFKSTAKQLTLENKLVRSNSINVTFGPEKEQQSSGLVLGLGIFFGMLLITIIIIYTCCIWKKSRKSSFDLNLVEATIPLNSIETKEPSSGGEKK